MNKRRIIKLALLAVIIALFASINVSASVTFDLGSMNDSENAADTVQILLLLTVIAMVPSILLLMTGFTRIVIMLSFVRSALGLQQTPPNQVLIGLALFLTLFLMSPILSVMNETALQPYINEEINQDEAISAALVPLREFMLKQTYIPDLNMFLSIAGEPQPEESLDEIKIELIIPAFVISELKRAFIFGFFIYIPFIIIDLVVASTLMSLGMMMLPPSMVAMPFKLILFLIVDGWGLLVQTMMASFN